MTKLPSILQEILAHKHTEVSQRRSTIPAHDLEQKSQAQSAPRGFAQALSSTIRSGENAVIAEVKKASPSAGLIRADFDPAMIAQQYQNGGASCLSVLTDERYFQGHDDFLLQARSACQLPVLRKDFVVDHYQISEARALGADAILLIVAALDDVQLDEFNQHAIEWQLDVLIEVHNELELERALKLSPALLGINNRDLNRFVTDLGTSERLMQLMPENQLAITESGIHNPAHVQRMNACGIHAFLIGESLMRQPDPGVALHALVN